jgi:hypothetical protein
MDPVAVLAHLRSEDKRLTALAMDTDMDLDVLNHLVAIIIKRRRYADLVENLVFALETKDLGTIIEAENIITMWSTVFNHTENF